MRENNPFQGGAPGGTSSMSSVELKNSKDLDRKEPGADSGWSFRNLLIVSATFLVALILRLWFAFFDGHEVITYSCDASEYLRGAQTIASVFSEAAGRWQDILLFSLGLLPVERADELHQLFLPMKEMLHRAGPTFPLFILFSYVVTGNELLPEYLYAPVIFHSLITSLTCACTAYVGIRLWNRPTGIFAGLLTAFYPGFIVNSLRLYSESYAAFWLMASLALLTYSHFSGKWKWSLLMGSCLAVLQITRSALFLVTGATLAFLTFFADHGRLIFKKSIILTLLGLALVMIPLNVMQNLAVGKSSLVQDRLGHYNLFVGLDVSAQGWLSYPYPDGRGIEEHSFLQLMHRRYEESHSRFIKLLMDKPLRLFKFPWNDFRTPIGPFGENIQVFYHQLCLMLAALGIGVGLLARSKAGDQESEILEDAEKKANQKQIQLRILVLLLTALHSAYFFFITVPRYALTSMPLIILFSGAGLFYLSQQLSSEAAFRHKLAGGLYLAGIIGLSIFTRPDYLPHLVQVLGDSSSNLTLSLVIIGLIKLVPTLLLFGGIFLVARRSSKYSAALTIAMALATIPFITLPLRAQERFFEWDAPLSRQSGQKNSLVQSIYLPKEKREELSQKDAYLLIDSSNWKDLGQFSRVKINSQPVQETFLPIMPFAQDLKTLSKRKESQGEILFYECEDIYKSVLEAAGGANLDPRQWFILPVPQEIISSALQSSSSSLVVELEAKSDRKANFFGSYIDGDARNAVWIPSVGRYSWEKFLYGCENEFGFTDSRFDEKYPVERAYQPESDLSSDAGKQTGAYNIRLLLAPGKAAGSNEIISSVAKDGSRPFTGTTDSIKIKTYPDLSFGKDDVWMVTFKGTIDSEIDANIQLPVNVEALVSSKSGIYKSPWVPSSIDLQKGKNEFAFSFPVAPSTFEGLEEIKVSMARGGVADGTQYFGTFYKPDSRLGGLDEKQFENLIKARLKWLESSLTIRKMPHYPTALGYEIL